MSPHSALSCPEFVRAKWTPGEPYNHGPNPVTVRPFRGPPVVINPGETLRSEFDDDAPGGRRLLATPWGSSDLGDLGECKPLPVAKETKLFRVSIDCELDRQLEEAAKLVKAEPVAGTAPEASEDAACRPYSTQAAGGQISMLAAVPEQCHRKVCIVLMDMSLRGEIPAGFKLPEQCQPGIREATDRRREADASHFRNIDVPKPDDFLKHIIEGTPLPEETLPPASRK